MGVNINLLRTKKPPCHGCSERTIDCHAMCEKYQAWAAERRAAVDKYHNQKKKATLAYNPLVAKRKIKK